MPICRVRWTPILFSTNRILSAPSRSPARPSGPTIARPSSLTATHRITIRTIKPASIRRRLQTASGLTLSSCPALAVHVNPRRSATAPTPSRQTAMTMALSLKRGWRGVFPESAKLSASTMPLWLAGRTAVVWRRSPEKGLLSTARSPQKPVIRSSLTCRTGSRRGVKFRVRRTVLLR
ncbi:Uncharacterised protein [Klebsiella pneumoniae]|nr:Uncharacterised protein [Klebsiella pneumoniae]